MLIHVQRESGLAHRTLSLAPWQVQVLRIATTKWFLTFLVAGLASWVFFAVQAARVPLLTNRLTHMEEDARRLDTLQQALTRLQQRYDQVQHMLSAPTVAVATPGVGGVRTPRPTAEVPRAFKPDSATKLRYATARSDSINPKRAVKIDSVTKQKVP
ncbi:MAG: hypothetical protein HYR75_00570 [Gemmatimonadetes bacterium]|nr:hypothetical protein [Gemmatimonadota bacterium]